MKLKKYVDARVSDLRSAIEGSRQTMEKRLDGMNEFRDSLKDQAEKFASKESVDAIERQVHALQVTGGGAAGRAPFIDAILKIGIGLAVGYALFRLTS